MSDDIKFALKEAKGLLKDKKYIDAIKKCRKILKKDKDNYLALVILGATMIEVEEYKLQAPVVLQRATSIEPENPLAWQGLITYYEKDPVDVNTFFELAKAYCKVLQSELNFTKFSMVLNKISDLLLKYKDNVSSVEVIKILHTLRESLTDDRKLLMDKFLASVLTEYPDMGKEFVELLQTVLASVVKDVEIRNRQNYFGIYLEILYESKKLSSVIDEAKAMHQIYPEDIRPLEWICRVYYEQYFFCAVHEDVRYFCEMLLILKRDSVHGLIAKATYMLDLGNLIGCREQLNNIVLKLPTCFYVWFLLSEVTSKLYCWEEAENAANRALELNKLTSNQLKRKLQVTLVTSWTNSKCENKWNSAMKMCAEILAEEPSYSKFKVLQTHASILMNQPDALYELTVLESQFDTKSDAVFLRALYLFNCGHLEEAMHVLLDLDDKSSAAWSLLGKIYWEMADYDHSYEAFLNAVQEDRHNWECFVRLGCFYAEKGNDIFRAKRCYKKALQINPNSVEAGVGLCTAYRLLNDTEANVELLQHIIRQQNAPKWAWLQLGLQYLDQQDLVEAIRALQCAIRADPNDNHSWESLADAYWARGACTSALRSYQRALDLSPGSLYPMIQLANIKLIIGQHAEAENDFQSILEKEQRYVPALKGLAEARLALAKQNIARHFLCRARDNLQEALDSVSTAIMERNNISCLWKILGDICHVAAIMPDKYCYLNVMSVIARMETVNEKIISIGREELFSVSARCYCRALSISRDSALLWHDLACSYFTRSQYGYSNDIDELRKINSKAMVAAKQAVILRPSSWFHWNILGVICMSEHVRNYALAQHCFAMAIDIEPNNPTIWTNLGTLYLYLDEPYKGNEAFSRAQRADPAYINSWIGQAMIAEKIGHKDAMDLFRHAMELGYHDEAALGYARSVLTVLLDSESKKDPLYTYIIEKMHAVPMATDALHWYNERHSDNDYALNAQGLLLERIGLYRQAAELFNASLRVCKDEEQMDGVRINLARICLHIQKYAEAVQLCKAVKRATFNSQCHLALALFKADHYEESYSAYETALHWLANDSSDKANVLCAMAAIAHIFQGAEDAKTLLFQCLQIQPRIVAGFLAAAALGILHNDAQLTTLVLRELKPFEKHPEYRCHIVTLSAYSYLLQNDAISSIRLLSKAIHRYPDDAGCWASLVRVLAESNSVGLSQCVQKALFLSRRTSTTNIVRIACASVTSYLENGLTKVALRPAQKTVFSFPANTESWASFIAVLLSGFDCKHGSKPCAKWISNLISVHLKGLPVTSNLKEWLNHSKKMVDVLANS